MTKKIAIHSFFTSGYADWAELFIQSICSRNGNCDIYIDTVNLTKDQIDIFENKFEGVFFTHHQFDYSNIAEHLVTSQDNISRLVNSVENGEVNNKNYILKVYVSVELRYKILLNRILNKSFDNYNCLIHADIDVYFRCDPLSLVNKIGEFDFAAIKRNVKNPNYKILGAFLIFNLKNCKSFVETWLNEINSIPIVERPRGFGQLVIYNTLKKHSSFNFINIENLDKNIISKTFDPKALIWLNSNYSIKRLNVTNKKDVGRLISWIDLTQSNLIFQIEYNIQFEGLFKKNILLKI